MTSQPRCPLLPYGNTDLHDSIVASASALSNFEGPLSVEPEHSFPYPSLYAAFEAAAARKPARVIIRDGATSLTYSELHAKSRDAARALMSLGIKPGDSVAIWAVNRPEWIVAALGIQATGASLVPAGTRLKPREVGDILRRISARVLFCDPSFGSHDFVQGILAEDLPALEHIIVFDDRSASDRVTGWPGFLGLAGRVGEDELNSRISGIGPDAIADILFTSGTTGSPKGVPMTHGQSLLACQDQQRFISRLTERDVFAAPFPFAHNAGYRAAWQICLLYGARILPLRTYDASDLLTLIECEGVTILPASPPIYQAILDHPELGKFDLSSLRLAITGGTMTPVRLIERMQAVFGKQAVMTSYGLTETAGSVTTTSLDDPPEVVATTTGKPFPTLELRLLDSSGDPVPPGEPGEVAIRGRQVLHGYLDDPEATAQAFTADGFFLTGDVGVLDEQGNLRITDRLKDMYIVGGFNAYPAEIEQQICRLQGVKEAAVVGIDDERLGQVGRAFIVRQAGSDLDAATVTAWCRETLANYKVPRLITFIDELPRNNQGKVAKTELRKLP